MKFTPGDKFTPG